MSYIPATAGTVNHLYSLCSKSGKARNCPRVAQDSCTVPKWLRLFDAWGSSGDTRTMNFLNPHWRRLRTLSLVWREPYVVRIQRNEAIEFRGLRTISRESGSSIKPVNNLVCIRMNTLSCANPQVILRTNHPVYSDIRSDVAEEWTLCNLYSSLSGVSRPNWWCLDHLN